MSKDKKLCCTLRCMNKRAKGRRYCGTCRKKKWREKHPVKAAYAALKFNATRRKIFFDLTYEQFEKFAIETDYLAGKGRSKLSYTVDREIEEKGYTVGNLQLLTKSENSAKEQARRKKVLAYDYQTGYARVI